jgi:hypothetical protein
MLCHARGARDVVYQFNYLDELRSFGDRLVWLNPLWFWEYRPTGKPQDASAG